MTIDVVPDPQRPHGGGAILRLPADAPVEGETTIAIYDRSRQRWLGDKAWQPSQERFGPYPVQVAANGMKEIAIGSEIVDHIEEYTPLSVHLGKARHDVDWPDTILYAPGSPSRAGIVGADEPEPSRLTGTSRMPTSPRHDADPQASKAGQVSTDRHGASDAGAIPSGEDIGEPDSIDAPGQSGPEPAEKAAGRNWLPYILAGVAATAAAGALAVFLMRPEPITSPVTENGTEEVPPVIAADACDPGSLAGLGADFAAAMARLRQCGDAIEPDTALAMLERGAAAGDPDALTAFGQLYDTDAADHLLEDQIGLGFGDRPDVAARYYARARDGGSAAGEAALQAVCERIETLSDALIVETAAEYCE